MWFKRREPSKLNLCNECFQTHSLVSLRHQRGAGPSLLQLSCRHGCVGLPAQYTPQEEGHQGLRKGLSIQLRYRFLKWNLTGSRSTQQRFKANFWASLEVLLERIS